MRGRLGVFFVVVCCVMLNASCVSRHKENAVSAKAADADRAAAKANDSQRVAVDGNSKTLLTDRAVRYAGMPDFPSVGLVLRAASQVGAAVEFKSHCTGTLISPNLVLTAAHCICNESASLGTFDECVRDRPTAEHWRTDNYRVFFQHSGVYKVRRLEIFGQSGSGNGYDHGFGDLAVFELDRSVENVKAAELMPDGALLPGGATAKLNSIVVGFGLNGVANTQSGIKFHAFGLAKGCSSPVDMGTVEALCSYWKLPPATSVEKASVEGIICKGDSGGPMFAFLEAAQPPRTQKFELLGVASRGTNSSNCGQQSTSYHVKINLPIYANWIKGQIALANTGLASMPAIPVNHPRTGDMLEPVFNEDVSYFIDNNDRSGVFEKGFIELGASEIVSQSFLVPSGVQHVRVTANATKRQPTQSAALTLKVVKISGTGTQEICAVSNATQNMPVLECPVTKVTAGTYRVEIAGAAGRSVQFAATAYSNPLISWNLMESR